MSANQNIVIAATEYAKGLLSEVPKEYSYHNLVHTQEVTEYAQEIGKGSGLNEEQLEIMLLATWFHDIGYTNNYKDHESESASMAESFLKEQGYPEEGIKEVVQCILATNMRYQPQTLMEKVICDADLANLGKKKFWKRGKLLLEEWRTVCGEDMSELEWYTKTHEFLSKHEYYTEYGRQQFTERKNKNLKKVQRIIETMSTTDSPGSKKAKKDQFGRGVETMFRTSSRNHIQLSAIADNKANIMLSINAIIISIVVSVLVPRFSSDEYLILPTVILLVVCVLTIIFATISTIPKVTSGKFTQEDIEQKRANLLFFGNFHKMKLQEFESAVGEMMKDKDFLYGSMTRDLYFLGKVLDRKYRYLRFCYNVFMYGLVIAVSTFIGSYLYFN